MVGWGDNIIPPFFLKLENGIMNKLAELVNRTIIGDFVNICISGVWYKVSSPTVYTLTKMIKPLSKIKIEKDDTVKSLFDVIENDSEALYEALAIAVYANDRHFIKVKKKRLKKKLRKADISEVMRAFEEIITLFSARDFFLCAQLAKNITTMTARHSSEVIH